MSEDGGVGGEDGERLVNMVGQERGRLVGEFNGDRIAVWSYTVLSVRPSVAYTTIMK